MNAKNLVGFVVLCVASLFCLCNRAVGQEKNYWVAENPHNAEKAMFFIEFGNIKLEFVTKDDRGKDSVSVVFTHGESTFVSQAGHLRMEWKPGNLKMAKEPSAYVDGFSEQDGVVVFKTDNECLFVCPHFLGLHWVTINDMNAKDMIGKKRMWRGKEKVMKGTDAIPLNVMVYSCRYWKDGTEVTSLSGKNEFTLDKKNPPSVNNNRYMLTDAELHGRPSAEIGDYRDATISVTEGKPFIAGGLKIVLNRTTNNDGGFIFKVEAEDGLNLFYTLVIDNDLSKLVNPNERPYKALLQEGLRITPNKVKLIRAESNDQTTKFLALKLSVVDKTGLSCKLRFWSDQPQLVAQKPDKKTF